MRTPAHGIGQRMAAHERAARRYDRLFQRVDGWSAKLAAVRFVAFLVAGACGFAWWYDREVGYAAPTIGAAVVFSIAVWLHRRPFALAPRLGALARIHREDAARLRGDWAAVPHDGAQYLDPARPMLSELQLFGRGSVFQLVDHSALPGGRERLAHLLRTGASPDLIPARQAAARELARKSRLRHRLAAEGRVVQVDEQATAEFLAWGERASQVAWLKPRVYLGAALLVATWVQVVLTFGFEWRTLWQATFLGQCAVYAATTRRLTAAYLPLIGAERHRPFVALKRMFALIERARFDTPSLVDLRDRLGEAGDRPSERLERLDRVVESLAVRHSALLYSVLALGFMWELFQCARLERWRDENGDRLRTDLARLSDFEALASIAGFAADHPAYGWPTVSADGPAIATRAAGHPLFSRDTRVENDFTLADHERLVLITGSNMSGKSSFLRTLGINTQLALAGAPVCALEFQVRPCVIESSIQVTDAPEQGLSRFYAEVKRIAAIVTSVEASEADARRLPRFYLVDEMLSGTNSRERRLASRTIVRRLAASDRSFGLVTTHDLGLVKLAEDAGTAVPCYHFADRFDGEALHFDYTLKEGVATTTNALHVLRLAGIDVPA